VFGNLFLKNDILAIDEYSGDIAFYNIDPEQASRTMTDINKYAVVVNPYDTGVVLGSTDDIYAEKDETISTEKSQLEREYVVEKGDTITTIANKFGIHVATILDRNNLKVDDIENIKSGQTIIIPSKDTSDSKQWLADLNYKKEEERKAAIALEQKKQAEALKKQQLALKAANDRNTVVRNTSSSRTTAKNNQVSSSRSSNTYAYGYCTWYAAQKRPDIPNRLGNGGAWYSNAQSQGLATGQTPQAGAVVVTGESWVGHVAYVESVNGNTITVSEMNYEGWNKVSTRTINASASTIKGYIY